MFERWRDWIAAFDASAEDDDWSRLAPFLAEDVVYVVAGAPFGCELRGREAVIAGFAKSIRNFDRKFDKRGWHGVGIQAWTPGIVTGRAMGHYQLAGAPDLTFSAHSQWFFRGDRLSIMTDVYDVREADVVAALQWLGTYGQGFDPAYA